MPVNLVFYRHAQGTHNKMAELEGDTAYNDPVNIDANLTDLGVKQTVDNRIFDYYDAIYCSPMRRCRQTLLGIYPSSNSLPVILDDRLMEQPCGKNLCDKRLEKSEILPEFPPSWNHEKVAEDYLWHLNQQVDLDKITGFTNDLLQDHQNETILIVSHGQWINRWLNIYKQKNLWVDNCQRICESI